MFSFPDLPTCPWWTHRFFNLKDYNKCKPSIREEGGGEENEKNYSRDREVLELYWAIFSGISGTMY